MPSGVYKHKSRPCSEETKRKIGLGNIHSRRNTGMHHTEEWKHRMRLAHLGKRLPEEQRKNQIETLRKYWATHKRVISEKLREKMKEGHKKYYLTEEGKAHRKRFIYSGIGRKPSKETRKKLSESHKGKNHWNWQGGISRERERVKNTSAYKEWRLMVFGRDNYTCQKCGDRGVYLHAHHVLPFAQFPESRFDVSNGLTLCINCHKNIHRRV